MDAPEKGAWINMLHRCNNSKCKGYGRYGGRGIEVCDEWTNSFANFLQDVGTRPSKNHVLDRVDNNGNYNKHNCRWVTKIENEQNTSKSKWWFVLGARYTSVREASLALKIPISTVRYMCEKRTKGCYSELKYKEKKNG